MKQSAKQKQKKKKSEKVFDLVQAYTLRCDAGVDCGHFLESTNGALHSELP